MDINAPVFPQCAYRTLRIGNRRWGENGYVRGGRIEARPVVQAGGSGGKGKKSSGGAEMSGGGGSSGKGMGRRAKRTQKREMVDAEGYGNGSSSLGGVGGKSGGKGKGRCS